MTPTLGLARIEAYSGVPEAKADIVAQWLSLTPGWAGVCLRPSQGRPLVYLESHLDEAGYRAILRGEYDRRLLQVRDTLLWARDPIVRWDHEMDGPQNEWRRWGGMDPELYIDVWRYVSTFLGPMFWCPTSVTERWSAYFPGDEYISHIGWDQYADKAPLRPLPLAWAKRVIGVAFIWWPLAIVIGGAIMLAAAVLWAWLNVKPKPEDTGGPGE
jgi:hypothetical protein